MQNTKEKWVKPELEIIKFSDVDIIIASNGFGDKPGHGYSDKNHEHTHWKDR